jgi:hypothetical protein
MKRKEQSLLLVGLLGLSLAACSGMGDTSGTASNTPSDVTSVDMSESNVSARSSMATDGAAMGSTSATQSAGQSGADASASMGTTGNAGTTASMASGTGSSGTTGTTGSMGTATAGTGSAGQSTTGTSTGATSGSAMGAMGTTGSTTASTMGSASTPPGTPNSTVASIDVVPRPSGRTGMGTVAGAAVGGATGTAGTTMTGDRVYRITLRMDDGTTQSITQEGAPAFRPGERLRVINGVILR